MLEPSQPSTLDRLLRLFTDVRAGEGLTALLLSANVFVLLTCYSVLKPVREALILGQGSAEIKAYTAAGQVLVLAAVVPLYGRLADRVPRRRLINVVTAIFAACLAGFYGLARLAVPLGVVFYIWLGIFSVMLVAQFWGFANDIYSKEEGERLFPIVAFGASLGAVLGAGISSVLIAPLGVYQMLLVAAALLVAQLQITNYVDARERRAREAHLPPDKTSETLTATGSLRLRDIERMLAGREAVEQEAESREAAGQEGASREGGAAATPPGGREPDAGRESAEPRDPGGAGDAARGHGAFALVLRTRYLLAIGLLMMMLNLVNTTGEYILAQVVAGTATNAVATGTAGGLSVEAFIGSFYARFQLVVNIVGVLVQLFLVSRIVKYLGVRVAVLILPLISLGAYSLIAFYPVLGYIRWAKTAENATDYSLNNTVRNMLFLPTTREQKYKAKQAIDSFFVRLGDTLSAALVFFGTQVVVLGTSGFALVNGAIVAVWLALAFWIGREYQRLVDTGARPS